MTMPGDYSEELVELVRRTITGWATDYPIPAWGLARSVDAERLAGNWARCLAPLVLDALSSSGRLVPEGELVGYLAEGRLYAPQDVQIVRVITTPWTPTEPEEKPVEGGHIWSPPGDIQQCVNCHQTRGAYFATSARRPCPRPSVPSEPEGKS